MRAPLTIPRKHILPESRRGGREGGEEEEENEGEWEGSICVCNCSMLVDFDTSFSRVMWSCSSPFLCQ